MQTIESIPAPPARPVDGHKGTFGTVVVVGGCPSMPGAPALAARAAIRAGAGLVKILTDAVTLPIVLGIEPCATGADPGSLPESAVYAVGPGWGQNEDRGPLALPPGASRVIDADGLNRLAAAWAEGLPPSFAGPTVLTPHPGEYRRLAAALGIDADPVALESRPEAAQRLAEKTGAVVLLKGHRTVIVDPVSERCFVNVSGTPALAVAGSGDVLTGAIAALMAQGMTGFAAARLGAFAHGLAGEAWAQTHGPAGMRALELADRLPITLNEIRNNASS